MAKRLEGKVAVVTGGDSGIGFATAELFAQEGAHVFITGRRAHELDEAAKKIGANATAVQGDVTKQEDLDRLYTLVQKLKGRLDILFANAGMGEYAPLGSITEEHYDKIFDINVKGLIFTVQKALPLMKAGASIILNASVASKKGIEKFSVYCASKAAVRSFARSWVVDLKGRNIRINAVSPGVIPTHFFGAMGVEEEIKKFEQYAKEAAPLGRTGTSEEIAKAVLFLASDDSSYVTGAELFVDGGLAQI